MNDRVKIVEAHHPGGMPVAKSQKIVIGGVGIELSREDFQELAGKISDKAGSDLAKTKEIYDQYWESQQDMSDMVKRLRSVFYDSCSEDEFFFPKDVADIDSDELKSVLQEYSKKLGLS